jgi:hypothetical protein
MRCEDRSCSKSIGLDRIKDYYAVILAPLTSNRQEDRPSSQFFGGGDLHVPVYIYVGENLQGLFWGIGFQDLQFPRFWVLEEDTHHTTMYHTHARAKYGAIFILKILCLCMIML